jgi:hypothetical protein
MKPTDVCFTARPDMTQTELDSSASMRASKMTLDYDAQYFSPELPAKVSGLGIFW